MLAAAFGTQVQALEVAANTSNCAALLDLAGPDFSVERAEIIPAGPAQTRGGSGEPLPEHCLVQGVLNPRVGADDRRYGIGSPGGGTSISVSR